MELWQILIAFGGGLLAGVINTLAGNGSAITLAIMTELLGLPGNVANGSNRLGVIAVSLTASATFRSRGILKFRRHQRPIFLTVIGAIIGVAVAVSVTSETFRQVFKYLMVFMLIFVLVKPSRWIRTESVPGAIPQPVMDVLLLLLGFYGGFIQMGMGIFFIALTVLGAGYTMIQANAMKVAVVAVYSIIALGIFWAYGYIDWLAGGIIAAGQMIGGYFTARYASKYEWINTVAYILLVLVILASVMSLFFF